MLQADGANQKIGAPISYIDLKHMLTSKVQISKHQKKLEEELSDKKILEFDEDFFAMAVLCYLEETTKEWMLKA